MKIILAMKPNEQDADPKPEDQAAAAEATGADPATGVQFGSMPEGLVKTAFVVKDWAKKTVPSDSKHCSKDEKARLIEEAAPYIKENNLQFVYLQSDDAAQGPADCKRGGAVIAYVTPPLIDGRLASRVVEISTSLCAYENYFDRKIGRSLAALSHQAGYRILVRLKKRGYYSQQLAELFNSMG
jgi:hypothetical protein